eukprot:TRINITY_DN10120_c0_g1_i4.p1 TRINITY_DN10120_c0_g1~~TRINITY_DN10120_c0_g1_i4.p1  ORF type:complete len:229 (+),score=86.27 TRINITY_DN10120_c0_g1_i4:68-754(+)
MFLHFFFFFKQKTAYEMLRSLVGSEMCIRDRNKHQIVKLDGILQDERASHDSQTAAQASRMQAEITRGLERNQELAAIVPDLETQLQALRGALTAELDRVRWQAQELSETQEQLRVSKRATVDVKVELEEESLKCAELLKRSDWLQCRLVDHVITNARRSLLVAGFQIWRGFVHMLHISALEEHADEVTALEREAQAQAELNELEGLNVGAVDVKRIALLEFGLKSSP